MATEANFSCCNVVLSNTFAPLVILRQYLFSSITNFLNLVPLLNHTGTKNLMKWKGVMFAPETDDKTISEQATTTTSSEPDSSCCTTIATNPTPGTEKDFDAIATDDEGHQVNRFFLFFISLRSSALLLSIGTRLITVTEIIILLLFSQRKRFYWL